MSAVRNVRKSLTPGKFSFKAFGIFFFLIFRFLFTFYCVKTVTNGKQSHYLLDMNNFKSKYFKNNELLDYQIQI